MRPGHGSGDVQTGRGEGGRGEDDVDTAVGQNAMGVLGRGGRERPEALDVRG